MCLPRNVAEAALSAAKSPLFVLGKRRRLLPVLDTIGLNALYSCLYFAQFNTARAAQKRCVVASYHDISLAFLFPSISCIITQVCASLDIHQRASRNQYLEHTSYLHAKGPAQLLQNPHPSYRISPDAHCLIKSQKSPRTNEPDKKYGAMGRKKKN